ncbi:adenylate/guanylate cyclase domain-containing protein [Deltaproteobacteria bacterium]|nr:adenylate/guanylate cyclase domain-containing protein [Deltaproteobacteria bacterium]
MKKFLKSFLSLNPTSISTCLIIFAMAIYIIGIPILDLIEFQTFDLRFQWRGIKEPSPVVVAAVVDEKSLDREGRWPWPRNKIAELIEKLSEDGARVIGFDIFFTEPDENSNLKFISQLDEKIDSLKIQDPGLKNFIEENKLKADNDRILANAIKNSDAKVILPYFFFTTKETLGYDIGQEEIDNRINLISNSVYGNISGYKKEDMAYDPFLNAALKPYAPEVNLEILSQAATNSGYINMLTSEDGIVRNMPLAINYGENIFTPLSIQCVWQYMDQSNPDQLDPDQLDLDQLDLEQFDLDQLDLDRPNLILEIAEYGIEGIVLGDVFIPTDEDGQLLVNYLGPPQTFPHYSITDILQGTLPKGTFDGKIVIVGSTAVGAHDLRNTPFSPAHPGLEIHTTIIDNILRNDFISKPHWANIYDFLAIMVLGILLGIIIPRSGAITGLSVTAVMIVLHILGSRWLFSYYGLWVNMVYPLLTVFLIYTSLTAYHYLVEERNKRFLHSTFSSYLSPELIEDMVSSETMPELGGEERVISAYFTDIQGFSNFSEKLTAHQLVELLNEYLSVMTDLIIEQRGTLDKYEGDAIIAFIGAPLLITDHTMRACRVAIDMQGELLDLREKWKKEKQLPNEPNRNTKNLPPEEWAPGYKWPRVVHDMKMRIGINSGEIVIGNMGSSMRMNYTMMGDSVNLAARLEEGAKQYGIYTAVSEYTLNMEYVNENGEKEKAMDAVEARFIDNITVVGKSEPVKVYELCAMKGELSPQEKELFNVFDKGMRCYLNMEWDAAIDLFKESLKIERIPDGITTPSEVYIKRCEAFKETPPVAPGEKWDGVFRMTKK